MIRFFIPAVALAAGLAPAPAAAQQVESAYSDLDLNLCSIARSDDMGSTWMCPGHKGFWVMIAEGDLRFFVSYGLDAPDEKAATQTLPPFNTLGSPIEWRMSNAEGGWKPFATIVRYFVEREAGAEKGQVLVVTRLGEGTTCHIAYIDALANPNANEMARRAADERARGFDCANEPERIGNFGAWTTE